MVIYDISFRERTYENSPGYTLKVQHALSVMENASTNELRALWKTRCYELSPYRQDNQKFQKHIDLKEYAHSGTRTSNILYVFSSDVTHPIFWLIQYFVGF